MLARQRARDLLGPDPIEVAISHSLGFAAALAASSPDEPGAPAEVVDLGSGGGVPGLVLATLAWTEARFVLVDASQRRGTYLELAVADLDLGGRVAVEVGRAEDVGRGPRRASAEVVVARSFGPPAVLAECAAPLLVVGGRLVVSEPPGEAGTRWAPEGIARVGLSLDRSVQVDGATYTVLRQVEPCPERFPRRPGVPGRKPLF